MRTLRTVSIALALLILSTAAAARTLTIKMGTVAPKGSVYHKALLEMAEVFEQETDGKVKVKIYAAVVGDEPTIVRKMRVGQLHAAALTNTGLALITTEPIALQLPMQFDSTAELDHVMAEMTPVFDRALEEDGFVTLTWADGGWVYFFTKKPAQSLEDIKGRKMWMWAHDPDALKSFAAIGFAPVVLSGVDIIPSLQTGMIEALPTTAITALALQTYPLTPHVIDVKWGVMLGGTVISKQAWEKVPAEARPKIRARCMEIGKEITREVRAESARAMAIMKSKGVQVHTPDAAQLQAWRELAKKSQAIVRGGSVDAALADQAMQIRDRYRAQQVQNK